MRRNIALALLTFALAGLTACAADEDALEAGDADLPLDRPAAIEQAPLADDVGPEGLNPGVTPVDTLQGINIDVQGDTAR